MVMLIPIAMPLVTALGISPVHFAWVIIGCVGIGLFRRPCLALLSLFVGQGEDGGSGAPPLAP